MKNKRQFFYRIGIILGAIFTYLNMIFNNSNDSILLELSAPIIIYISLFAIRIIRIPQIIFEFFLILVVYLSIDHFSKYFIIIIFIALSYWFTILALHFFRIWPLVED